jgi:hypothetical protein
VSFSDEASGIKPSKVEGEAIGGATLLREMYPPASCVEERSASGAWLIAHPLSPMLEETKTERERVKRENLAFLSIVQEFSRGWIERRSVK